MGGIAAAGLLLLARRLAFGLGFVAGLVERFLHRLLSPGGRCDDAGDRIGEGLGSLADAAGYLLAGVGDGVAFGAPASLLGVTLGKTLLDDLGRACKLAGSFGLQHMLGKIGSVGLAALG